MKKMILVWVVCFALTGCLAQQENMDGGRDHETSHLTAHYSDSLFKISSQGKYSVELRFKDGEFVVGQNTADLIIHRDVAGNRDVEGALITVVPWMPTMGHGVLSTPRVIERGAGLYAIENLEASMEGTWELRIDIDGVEGPDSAVFAIEHVRLKHFMGHGGEKPVSGMEMSGEAMSPPQRVVDLDKDKVTEGGLFKVSYVSRLEPVAINKIHAWELTLETRDGQPVTGATIVVDGDMPAHGHGMPTRPEVRKEIRPGVYLVEGMKFSMPGHWIVRFYVKAGAHNDAVTFNLNLM